ncbi:MAG: type II toxin-antitoxin system RelE/ParE family toxin [Candidatus Limnocylindrales bacterium]|jgi:hypothetical protein
MPWPVEVTDQFESWYVGLADPDRDAVNAAVDALEERGPGLGRPLVGEIVGSRQGQLKELRIGTVRILFRFDPRRAAILLIGGDKRGSGRPGIGRRSRPQATCTTPIWPTSDRKASCLGSDCNDWS